MFSIISIIIAIFLILLFIFNIISILFPGYLIIKTIIDNNKNNTFLNNLLLNFNKIKIKAIFLFTSYLLSKITWYCIPSIIKINKEIIINENYYLSAFIICFYLIMFYLIKDKSKLTK